MPCLRHYLHCHSLGKAHRLYSSSLTRNNLKPHLEIDHNLEWYEVNRINIRFVREMEYQSLLRELDKHGAFSFYLTESATGSLMSLTRSR